MHVHARAPCSLFPAACSDSWCYAYNNQFQPLLSLQDKKRRRRTWCKKGKTGPEQSPPLVQKKIQYPAKSILCTLGFRLSAFDSRLPKVSSLQQLLIFVHRLQSCLDLQRRLHALYPADDLVRCVLGDDLVVVQHLKLLRRVAAHKVHNRLRAARVLVQPVGQV